MPRFSYEQADVRLTGEFEEGRRAADFDAINEFLAFGVDQAHRHLGSDQLHAGLPSGVTLVGEIFLKELNRRT